MSTDTQNSDLLPLFALAPRPSDTVPTAADVARKPVVQHSEFGWDIRLDGPGDARRLVTEEKRPRWMLLFAALALASLGVIGATQPAVQSIPGRIAGAFHSGGDNPSSPPPGPPAPSAGPSNPTITAVSTPGIAAPVQPAPTGSTVLHLNAAYDLGGGVPSTTCDQGRTSSGICAWGFSDTSTSPLYVDVTWADSDTVQVLLQDSDGKRLASDTETNGPIVLEVTAPPSQVTVTVIFDRRQSLSVAVSVADHPL